MLTIDRVEAELTLLEQEVHDPNRIRDAITEALSRDPVARQRLRRVVLEILDDEMAELRRGRR